MCIFVISCCFNVLDVVVVNGNMAVWFGDVDFYGCCIFWWNGEIFKCNVVNGNVLFIVDLN